MQAGATQLKTHRSLSRSGLRAYSIMCSRHVASILPSLIPHFRMLSWRSRQTQGWASKAYEFNDSGPPVLLNNPCCCRRVVCCSFLKHAMEVHYG